MHIIGYLSNPPLLYKKHLLDALGRILVSWGHRVFQVSQHHTPSPRWPSWGWSSTDLRPSSNSWISPLQPKPPYGFLCCFASRLNGPLLGHFRNAQPCEDSAEWASGKSSAAVFYGLTEYRPASAPALLHQLLVLSVFPLVGFLNTLFPGHCQLQHDQLFWSLRGNDHVWPEWCCGNVLWELQLLSQVSLQLPVRGCVEEACWCFCLGFSPALMKLTAFFGAWWCLLVLVAEAKLSTTALSTQSWRQW